MSRIKKCFSINSKEPAAIVDLTHDEITATAAQELRKYLTLMLPGKTPPAAEDGAKKIYLAVSAVGNCPDSLSDLVKQASALKDDGFMIAPLDENRMAIIGKNSKGTLNGVYALLEKWGVCFAPQGLHVQDVIPQEEKYILEASYHESPVFSQRAFTVPHSGLFIDLLTLGKMFSNYDIMSLLDKNLHYVDWAAKFRLNKICFLSYYSSAWGEGKDVPRATIDGFIAFRDYPGVKWGEKFKKELDANRKMFRAVVDYAKDRGVAVQFFHGMIAAPESVLENYPDLSQNGHPFCGASEATYKYVYNVHKEFFELFPEVGFVSFLSADAGTKIVGTLLKNNCAHCQKISLSERIGKYHQAILDAQRAAGGNGPIDYWTWPFMNDSRRKLISSGLDNENRDSNYFVRRLDQALPKEITIYERLRGDEPELNNLNAVHFYLGEYRHHQELIGFHLISEHDGINCHPNAYIEGSWQIQAQYLAGIGVAGLAGEINRRPGENDPSGLGLCDLDVYLLARLMWDPFCPKDDIWQYWSKVYFPEVSWEKIKDILAPFWEIALALYTRSQTGGFIPNRSRFVELKDFFKKSEDWYHGFGVGANKPAPMNREHYLDMAAERQRGVDLLQIALEKLDKIKAQLGWKYDLWRRNMEMQLMRAKVVTEYVKTAAIYHLMEAGKAGPAELKEAREGLEHIKKLMLDFAVPPPPPLVVWLEAGRGDAYYPGIAYGYMTAEQWKQIFLKYVCEYERFLDARNT